jgi:hypothetical protein
VQCMAENDCFPEVPPDGLCLPTEADTVQVTLMFKIEHFHGGPQDGSVCQLLYNTVQVVASI